ncbi:hypothetical protein [Paenibacillus agaridevorans]|uniref:hypothetical protein n=1 Tax=Paenibacillus agaridevorans TaxID=171404 RepID=UPI001BE3D26E|nr:hypothetical protein [Paenibacillus agaridevorans]
MKKRVQWCEDGRGRANVYEKASTMARTGVGERMCMKKRDNGAQTGVGVRMCMKKRVQWRADGRGRADVYEEASTMARRRSWASERV